MLINWTLYQLTYLILKVGKLQYDKLVPVSVNLSKLSDVVKNDIAKRMYNVKIKKWRWNI